MAEYVTDARTEACLYRLWTTFSVNGNDKVIRKLIALGNFIHDAKVDYIMVGNKKILLTE